MKYFGNFRNYKIFTYNFIEFNSFNIYSINCYLNLLSKEN